MSETNNKLEIKNLSKRFGEKILFKNLSLTVDGPAVLWAPSGWGKTTLLRILMGLEAPTSGSVEGVGRVGAVFQEDRLCPQLTAEENVALVLTAEQYKTKTLIQSSRYEMTLLQLGLDDEALALPARKLSGGQKQRVAIARALANNPRVLLLDEPLGALDLQLRRTMQLELKRLQKKLGITFIYITHDQEEALTMSDTIVVMNQGYIQQIGTPEDIYNEPENAFVADFIGDSNIFNAIMVRDKLVNIVGAEFPCVDTGFGTNKPVDAVIRPEDIDLVKPEEGTLKGVVTHLIFKGVHYEMEVLANNYEWLVHSTDMFPVGTEVGIHVDPFDIQIMKKPESEDEEAVGIEE